MNDFLGKVPSDLIDVPGSIGKDAIIGRMMTGLVVAGHLHGGCNGVTRGEEPSDHDLLEVE